jgi:hypothetical protein
MKNLFSTLQFAQIGLAILFIVHRFFKPLGSDLMFGVLIASFLVGALLIFQSLRNPAIQGFQKTIGLILGFLPVLWVILLFLFVGTTNL